MSEIARLEQRIRELETQTAQRNDDRKQMARFLAICAKKAGGKIYLKKEDLESLPLHAVLTRTDDFEEGSVTFGWKPAGNHEY